MECFIPPVLASVHKLMANTNEVLNELLWMKWMPYPVTLHLPGLKKTNKHNNELFLNALKIEQMQFKRKWANPGMNKWHVYDSFLKRHI